MSTKSERYIVWLDALERERDELRAENEALQDQAFDLTERLLQSSTENERLRAELRECQDALRIAEQLL